MTHRSLRASVRLDPEAPGAVVGDVPARLFGSFVEHLGRVVHTGLHEPGHPTADEHGFRTDVLELVRELGVSVVRYPGGNVVSGLRWEDSVGPRELRPVRLDPAWHSVEDHQVGLHEFCTWAGLAGVEVMYALNLGTRGVQEAADLLEYANHPGGTTWSDLRRRHGAEEPLGIGLWCLGNEMDGPWQMGHKTADEYGRLAAETARMMRMIDPAVELVLAGSSSHDMATFGSWERTVLRHTTGLVDHLSVHAYTQEVDGDTASFVAGSVAFEEHLSEVEAIIDEEHVPGHRRVGIAVDEWNVWDQRHWNEVEQPALLASGWARHPRLLEQVYDATDAVVVGSMLGVLLRHCDRVSVANLAQLVNAIAPIVTEPGGPAWRQSTFHPFALTARLATGRSLRAAVDSEVVTTPRFGEVPALDVAATWDGARSAVFLTNRSLAHPVEVDLQVARRVVAARASSIGGPPGRDPLPETLRPLEPRLDGTDATTRVRLAVPPRSWSVLELDLEEDA